METDVDDVVGGAVVTAAVGSGIAVFKAVR